MGTHESIDINTELDECLRNALSAENRDKFLCFISVQPWLDAINAVIIFKNYPDSIYVAGGKEWADGGRTIKKESIDNPIKVILPYMTMSDKGYVSDNSAAKEAGLVIYGRFPTYKFSYRQMYVYDYMQTEGEPDNDIECMPKMPDFEKVMRREGTISLQYTNDNMDLRGQISYFDRDNTEEEVLFIREGISRKQACAEILKAWLDYRFDEILNYGFIATGERAAYKKKVIAAVNEALLLRYRIGKNLQAISCFNEIEKLSQAEKVKYLEDVLTLLRSIIGSCEEGNTFSLSEIIMLREMVPAIILFSGSKEMERGRTLFLIFLQKMNIECSKDEHKESFRKSIKGIYDKISEMTDEDYERLISNVKKLNITGYPRFRYTKKDI